MYLIVGLGNPGEQYEKTRHNAGFMALDAFAKKMNAPDFKEQKKCSALVTRHEDYLLAKPLTFMNRSGEAVQALANYYKISTSNIWILYDDIDLPLGAVRIRPSGGAGTHNGMKSVIAHVHTEDFPRIRIGIESRTAHGEHIEDIADFVLKKLRPEEKKIIEKSLTRVAEVLAYALAEGVESAMNRYN